MKSTDQGRQNGCATGLGITHREWLYVSLFWLCAALPIWTPVVVSAKKPDAGLLIAVGVMTVAVLIILCPWLARFSVFRAMFCWTDALSERALKALRARDLISFRRIASAEQYRARVKPYLKRMLIAIYAVMAVCILAPEEFRVLGAVGMFGVLYGATVVCLVSITAVIVPRKA